MQLRLQRVGVVADGREQAGILVRWARRWQLLAAAERAPTRLASVEEGVEEAVPGSGRALGAATVVQRAEHRLHDRVADLEKHGLERV